MTMNLKDIKAVFGTQMQLMFLGAAKAHANERLHSEYAFDYLKSLPKIDDAQIARLEKVAELIKALPNLNGAGLLTKEEHRKILKCLHPDSTPTAKHSAEAFAIFRRHTDNSNRLAGHARDGGKRLGRRAPSVELNGSE